MDESKISGNLRALQALERGASVQFSRRLRAVPDAYCLLPDAYSEIFRAAEQFPETVKMPGGAEKE